MTDKELKKYMTFNRGGQKHIPLFVTDINNSYILSAYQGSFSEYDISPNCLVRKMPNLC